MAIELKEILRSGKDFPTRKYIFEKEGKTVESVYIERQDKGKEIICVSNMFGCPVGCKFCASGENYYGNLDSGDIYSMVFTITEREGIYKYNRLLASFMGSGEPLLNIASVKESISALRHIFPDSYFALSTSGVKIENIRELYDLSDDAIDIHLKFSLHSPYDEQRKQIMPGTDNLNKIIDILSVSPFPVEINYCVLDKFNDSYKHAKDLAKLVNNTNFKLKLNKYHQINDKFKESQNKERFIGELKKEGIDFEIYSTDGEDIGAACGQLKSGVII